MTYLLGYDVVGTDSLTPRQPHNPPVPEGNITGRKIARISEPSPTTRALEDEFEDVFTSEENFQVDCKFDDYLIPNEGHPETIKRHLDLAERGIIVSTGTERSFFDILFSEESKCEGLVIRDINPKVKGYVDFNTLLLRISETREEYLKLSDGISPEGENKQLFYDRIDIIRRKIELCNLSIKVKEYYLERLIDFGCVYLIYSRNWKWEHLDNPYSECRYYLNDEMFLKLQKYAKAGNIISVVGDINDLTFLGSRKISVVDTSNICDYSIINIRNIDNQCKIIHTRQDPIRTGYFSFCPDLTDTEKKEFDELVGKVQRCCSYFRSWITNKVQSQFDFPDCGEDIGAFYTKNTLIRLRLMVEKYILEIPNVGIYLMERFCDRFNTVSDQEIDAIIRYEGTRNYLEFIVSRWVGLDLRIYLKFMKIEGWKEEFERNFSDPCQGLNNFLNRLRSNSLYDAFVEEFGAERLNRLTEKLKTA